MDADGHAVLAHAILDRLLHSPGPFQGCSGTTHAGNQSAYQP
jgi:hypothetical protein